MNFSTKGILAAVCLTGSLTIEHETEMETVSEDPTLVLFDHHLSFGFNNAYADDTDDGDEDPRQKQREQCIADAKETLDSCYANFDDMNWLARIPFEKQCQTNYSINVLSCRRL